MKLEIVSQGEPTPLELPEGIVTLGGSESDGVQLPGLPPGLLELRIEGDRLTLVSKDTFTIGEVLSPPGVPRLVLSGEIVELSPGIQLRQLTPGEDRAPAGTASVLRSLLGDAPEPDEVRCASLTCLTGLDMGRKFPLAGALAEIGRGEQVHVRVRDRSVSRKHARIRKVREGYLLEDAGSPNGVYLNGVRVAGPSPLKDGAVIELGHSLLRFKAPWTPPPPAEPPAPPDEAPTAPEPSPVEAHAAPVARPKQRARVEIALIFLGATLALVGVLVAFGFVAG